MCYGEGKIHWAQAYAEKHDIDLERSYFYTDSYSDLPMLQAVGNQRIVNPDPRLRLYASFKRWPVLRFDR
jgi:phosphoserine phosphatase